MTWRICKDLISSFVCIKNIIFGQKYSDSHKRQVASLILHPKPVSAINNTEKNRYKDHTVKVYDDTLVDLMQSFGIEDLDGSSNDLSAAFSIQIKHSKPNKNRQALHHRHYSESYTKNPFFNDFYSGNFFYPDPHTDNKNFYTATNNDDSFNESLQDESQNTITNNFDINALLCNFIELSELSDTQTIQNDLFTLGDKSDLNVFLNQNICGYDTNSNPFTRKLNSNCINNNEQNISNPEYLNNLFSYTNMTSITSENDFDDTFTNSDKLTISKTVNKNKSGGVKKRFDKRTRQYLQSWAVDNGNKPSKAQVYQIYMDIGLTKKQIREWFSNLRRPNRRHIVGKWERSKNENI
ncbi:hypothetical protein BB558_006672 [Smittium angustum]|uniref:Homeobox domain-containing protein n=1 Tax=Smittium angustum TaxID=133377 RepID=A0A2U1IX46_SMIAN|nr:hypothetical protein BB558_006672 [Smittium angustum]